MASGEQIRTLSFGPVTAEDRKRWRKRLEYLGPEEVRSRLNRTTTFDPDEAVEIGDDLPPWASRSFVETWLAEKRAEADRRERVTRWAAVIAAIAAVVAIALTVSQMFR